MTTHSLKTFRNNPAAELKLGEIAFDPLSANVSIGTGTGLASIMTSAGAIGAAPSLFMNGGSHLMADFHVNTNTVFSDPLAIAVRVDEFLMKDDPKRVLMMVTEAGEKLRRTVANETRCSMCPKFTMEVDEVNDYRRNEKSYRIHTRCLQAKSGMTGIVCPNGETTTRPGGGGLKQPPMNFEPSEMANREHFVPRDLPTTDAGDTAW